MKKRTTTVAVSGAFDPIQVGHVRYIQEAAKLGDRLVVILNGDNFLLKKKGFVFRPFAERKEILESIKGVDEVIASIDEDQTVSRTLEMLKPDVFAKGGNGELVPEAETCRKVGCRLVTNVGGGKIQSSSEKVRELGKSDGGKIKLACPYCEDHPILKEKCLYCGGTGKVEVGR